MEPVDREIEERELELPSEPMHLNMGPVAPRHARHGAHRARAVGRDGPASADVQIGYLHRGFEKMCERGTWAQVFPYCDRLNYVSPMLNNVGYALAVEKMLRPHGARSAASSTAWSWASSRASADHLTCIAAHGDGARRLHPVPLVHEGPRDDLRHPRGGDRRARHPLASAASAGWRSRRPALQGRCAAACIARILALLRTARSCSSSNRIFLDRLEGVGAISPKDAVALSWTGPCLRATGVAYDVRKAHPYLKYDEVDFDVPVGKNGDSLDRFMVPPRGDPPERAHHRAGLGRMPDAGPVNVDDPRVVLPDKQEVYTTIEATIRHFKLIMEGAKVPAGEVYSYTEAGNGELGFYLVSDGTGQPYRVRIRPPCFPITGGLSQAHHRPHAERHRPHLRVAQHDRRRV